MLDTIHDQRVMSNGKYTSLNFATFQLKLKIPYSITFNSWNRKVISASLNLKTLRTFFPILKKRAVDEIKLASKKIKYISLGQTEYDGKYHNVGETYF